MSVEPTGVVLAGGAGRRMGGDKALAQFRGEPLIARPLAALAVVCERVAVVCKPDTRLPDLPAGVERWDEPEEPRHPAAGILHALERAEGSVLVCAADMPFVTAAVLRSVAGALTPAGVAVVAVAGGVVQPVLAAYAPGAVGVLRSAAPEAPLTETVLAMDPTRVEVDAALAVSLDTPAALAAAEGA
jgi:molybdopterin-guanine dinucleotide biosynthesis protein A